MKGELYSRHREYSNLRPSRSQAISRAVETLDHKDPEMTRLQRKIKENV